MFYNIHKCFTLLQIIFAFVNFASTSLSQDAGPHNHVIQSWGSTRIKTERLRYTWTIENFSIICDQAKNIKKLSSPPFFSGTNDSCKWHLDLYPNGYSLAYYEDVSIILNPGLCTPKVQFHLGILNAKRQEVNIFKRSYDFNSILRNTVGGVPNFIKKKFLLFEQNGILSDDKLTVFCELNITDGFENISGKFKQPQQLQSHQLGKDLTYLFDNQNYSDVVIVADEKEFKALKGILASRSSVFKNIFESDIEHAKTVRVEINDLSYEVAKEMLRYIYTDEVGNLENLAPDLLVASEKYKLEGLKTLCMHFIADHLTIENVVQVYILGETHSAVDLKQKVRDFIITHASSVVGTPEFKTMIHEHPQIAEELFSALGDQLLISCKNKTEQQ